MSVVGPSPAILITDDDFGFRETLRGVLEPEGFSTLLADDGEQALEIVRNRTVHLVLLDMHMPKLTGLDTLRRVKQLKWQLPCILMSAAPDEGLVAEALRAEAFSVLPKPFTRNRITEVIRQAMHRAYNWQPPMRRG